MARRVAAATVFFLLAACAKVDPPPALDLAGLPAIRLAAQTVEVENRAPAVTAANFIAKRRSGQLAADAAEYLRTRVTAAGGTEFGRATVEEASLVEEAATGGGGGLLSTGPGRAVVGALALRLAMVDGLGIETGFASARVQIKRSLPARASIESEDRFTRQLTNDLIAAAGRDLDRSVQQNLAAYRAP